VGKTTLAKKIIQGKNGSYLLYEDDEDRQIILKKDYTHHKWVCLDEFHKFPRWKNHIKGVYDKYHETLHLLLTGSARLDVYQKSGDSLFGRYYLHHLHPLTVGELTTKSLPELPENILEVPTPTPAADINSLLRFSGFPEPFFKQSEAEHRRWQNSRRQLLIREELRDLTQVQLLGLAEQLMLILPARIGSLFSFQSLSEDILVSPPTIQNWMQLFERLFFVFKVMPYSKKIIRSIKKQPKYFLYDWSEISDEGVRFENLIASHLWKAAQIWTDRGLANLELRFVRDRDRREVDFLMVKNNKPWFLVECKLSETSFSENLRYFSQRLDVPGIQLVLKENIFKQEGKLLLVSAENWLTLLP
jgi:predicted AAA+ superfamily ATPase